MLVAFLAAACGRTSGLVEIPREDLPFDVTRTQRPTETPEAIQRHEIFFVRGERLTQVSRRLDAAPTVAGGVLRVLLEGPRTDEREAGVATEIPAGVRLLNASVEDGVARVDLSGEFQEPAPPERIALRVAQVVWTLTALREVRSVSFAIDGEAVAVITDDGAAVERRVSREDYGRFAPAP